MSRDAVFSRDGFLSIEHVLPAAEVDEITAEVVRLPLLGAGMRNLLAFDWCARLAQRLRLHTSLHPLGVDTMVPVQCTLFEKSGDRNWLVALHQDLSIPAAERIEHEDLHGWSHKDGMWFMQPPSHVTAGMLALRLHLDDCGPEDGPLKVVPGSHVLGRLPDDAARRVRDEHGETACCVQRGGVLALRPLLLHASSKSSGNSRRRVLHFLFGPVSLPYGLNWPTA